MVDIEALEVLAAERLTPMAHDYFRGGADDETTIAANVAAWRRIRLRPHVLRDVSAIDTATTLLGAPVRTPIGVAPTAYHCLADPAGECASAGGASDAGALFTMSAFATRPMAEVTAQELAAPRWFQVYVDPDRGFVADLVAQAAGCGFAAVVLTADMPVVGRRRRDERNGFALPPPLRIAHQPVEPDSPEAGQTEAAAVAGSQLTRHGARHLDPAVTLDDIGWLASASGLPVVVKGVLRGDDAAACLDAGAAAIWVSNHGGRQLDGAIATADALPEVVDAVAGRAEVYVDGGVRTGTDVLRGLALGARAVFLGRPVVYGLAAGGRTGVAEVLTGFTDELVRAMALCGVTSPSDLTEDLLA